MIVLVYGTRPEAIKLGPVAAELRALKVEFRTLCTGQHRELLLGTPAETDLAHNSRSLGLASDGNVVRWLVRAGRALKAALSDATLVVVQGDTMSAMAASRAADSLRVPLAHVEAGVRSHNLQAPWPEEGFRTEIDDLADWMYAPTTTSYYNLVAEGQDPRRVRVTGNTGVSALARYTAAVPRAPESYVLVTLHRRELLRDKERFQGVVQALGKAELGVLSVLWPAHPSASQSLQDALGGTIPARVALGRPLPYREAAFVLAGAAGVLTDSGGLQEEAATLGVPCAVLREGPDRPESVEAGLARVFEPTAQGVADACAWLRSDVPRTPSACFGDVTAASQVAAHLAQLAREE